EQGSEGVPTLRWYHRQFLEAALDRFCSDADTVEQMNQLMADQTEALRGPQRQRLRPGGLGPALRPDQPTRFEGGEFNRRRKLVELPHHLLLAGDIDSLKSHCLANFEFLHSLAKAKGVDACIEAFRAAL
uniref:HECT domain-containing protein n=1 Tax=Macrostomum lignano TaxID=282301 RepID=A0A1I8FQV0_9PLAT